MNNLTVRTDSTTDLITMDSMMKFANVVAKSGLCPKGLDTPEKVFVAVEWGKELNLSPMVAINNVAVVNGKPSLSTDIMHAIARNSPEYGGCKWETLSETKAECIVIRKTASYTEEVRGIYTIEDAKKAGLLNKDNWQKYPTRMLKHRALSYALRDAFPDLLSGIYNPEEVENTEPELINITPPEQRDEFDEVKPASKLSEKDFD